MGHAQRVRPGQEARYGEPAVRPVLARYGPGSWRAWLLDPISSIQAPPTGRPSAIRPDAVTPGRRTIRYSGEPLQASTFRKEGARSRPEAFSTI